jgi:hypothetical protein
MNVQMQFLEKYSVNKFRIGNPSMCDKNWELLIGNWRRTRRYFSAFNGVVKITENARNEGRYVLFEDTKGCTEGIYEFLYLY